MSGTSHPIDGLSAFEKMVAVALGVSDPRVRAARKTCSVHSATPGEHTHQGPRRLEAKPKPPGRETTCLDGGARQDGMSHALGARHGVAHGMGNAILPPTVMRFNAGRSEGAKRLKDVSVALGLAAPADRVESRQCRRRRGE
jgi:hypothetical protein